MPELDDVLASMRGEMSPDPDAKRRVRRALAGTLAGAATVGAAKTTAAAAPKVAGAAKAGLGAKAMLFKVTAGFGLVAGLSTAVLVFDGKTPEPASVVASVQRADSAAASAERGPEVRGEDELEAPVDTPLVERADEAAAEPASVPANEAKERSARVEATAQQGASASEGVKSTLLAELKLIREASLAVRRGDLTAARAALSEHRSKYPKSTLAHERTGLSLVVSCRGGATGSTRARAERFVERSPHSPIASQVTRSCLK